jgi:FG-GAP-like repeat
MMKSCAKTLFFKLAFPFTLSAITFIGIFINSESASAYHKTNKWEVRQSLEEGWIVIYSKEFSHAEYLKLSAAIAADVVGGSGSVTSAYFSDFASESVQGIGKEALRKAPDIADQIIRELTLKKVLSEIQASFRGGRVELSIAGMQFQIGHAAYNRAECIDTGFFGERCTPTPNTHQPYIRFRVGSSGSSTGSTKNNSSSGDFNRDGQADVLLYNRDSSQLAIWIMNVTTVSQGGAPQSLGQGWALISSGDFNRDGQADVLLYNRDSSQLAIWIMNVTTVSQGGAPQSLGQGWVPVDNP